MTYASSTDVSKYIQLRKLDESDSCSLLFDVPNPQSDIDTSFSEQDAQEAFNRNVERMNERALAVVASLAD